MPKRIPPLTDTRIEQAEGKEKPYRLFDGDGLYVEVLPSGSKVWRMKYRQRNGTENALTFGRYPDVSIAQARANLSTVRRMLKQDLDPRTEFNHEKLNPRPMPIPLEKLLSETDLDRVQMNILHVARCAIRQLEATVFPALARIPADEVQRKIQRAFTRQIEQAGLPDIYRQLEGMATALAGSYLCSGMNAEELALAVREDRNRTRRVHDMGGIKLTG